MKSNGFGSLQQTIIVHVPKEQASLTAKKLGVDPYDNASDPERSYFSWRRLTTRTGYDEDVVWDLSMILGCPEEELSWEIDWDASEY